MPNVVIRGFANVARFDGRDTRGEFWPYCAAAIAVYLIVGWVVLTPTMLPVFSASQVSPSAFQKMAGHFIVISWLLFGFLVMLLAGAVSRRLHDSGRSALWGLLPLPFAAYSGAMFLRLFSQFGGNGDPNVVLFLSVFASNVIYMAGIVTLIVFLTRRSTPALNRYG